MRKETGEEREEQQFYEGDVASPSYYLKHVVPITHSLVTDLLTMFITECNVYMRVCVVGEYHSHRQVFTTFSH